MINLPQQFMNLLKFVSHLLQSCVLISCKTELRNLDSSNSYLLNSGLIISGTCP